MTIIEEGARPLAETVGKYLSKDGESVSKYPYRLAQANPMITSKYSELVIGSNKPQEWVLEAWDLVYGLKDLKSCINTLKKALNKAEGIVEPDEEPTAVVNNTYSWHSEPDL